MKTALFIVAVGLGGAALAARPEPRFPESRSQIRETRAVAATAARPVVEAAIPASVPAPAPAPAASSRVEAKIGAAPAAESPDALVGVLTGLLTLTPFQKAQIQDILWERARRVGEYETEVARRGWARLADFEHRIVQIRDLADRRVMALLSSEQAALYRRALAVGIPEDHLSIEIPEGVVKLD